MCEQFAYSVIGVKCYFEVCPSKYAGDVQSFFTYVGKDGPLFPRCLGHLFLPWGVVVGPWGLIGERVVMEEVVDYV